MYIIVPKMYAYVCTVAMYYLKLVRIYGMRGEVEYNAKPSAASGNETSSPSTINPITDS